MEVYLLARSSNKEMSMNKDLVKKDNRKAESDARQAKIKRDSAGS